MHLDGGVNTFFVFKTENLCCIVNNLMPVKRAKIDSERAVLSWMGKIAYFL